MHTLTVTLKQHTPLIHFQHKQDRATLRATEVKPKLDRFILTKLGEDKQNQIFVKTNFHDEYVKLLDNRKKEDKRVTDLPSYDYGYLYAKKQDWLVGKGEHPALDYKMRITPESNKKTRILTRESDKTTFDKKTRQEKVKYFLQYDNKDTKKSEDFPMLLANMGGKEDKEQLVNLIIYDSINVVINCLNCKLLSTLSENIELFFATRNFAQRENKGFGSFSVIKRGIDEVLWNDTEYFENNTPYFKFSLPQGDISYRQYILFKTLDYYWKILKSGINYSRRYVDVYEKVSIKYQERYIKSYLWQYLQDKNKNWEKRKVKTHFLLETPFPVRSISNGNNPFFARALLGLPEKYEYRIPQKTLCRDDKSSRYKEVVREEIVAVSHSEQDKNKKIERIASPISLKPIINGDIVSVYVLFDENIINELNKHNNLVFTFSCKTNSQNLELSIDTEVIDYKELLSKYHNFLKDEWIPRNIKWENILKDNNSVSFYKINNNK